MIRAVQIQYEAEWLIRDASLHRRGSGAPPALTSILRLDGGNGVKCEFNVFHRHTSKAFPFLRKCTLFALSQVSCKASFSKLRPRWWRLQNSRHAADCQAKRGYSTPRLLGSMQDNPPSDSTARGASVSSTTCLNRYLAAIELHHTSPPEVEQSTDGQRPPDSLIRSIPRHHHPCRHTGEATTGAQAAPRCMQRRDQQAGKATRCPPWTRRAGLLLPLP
jgi:hypothetical protein